MFTCVCISTCTCMCLHACTCTCIDCVLILNPSTRMFEATPLGTAALSSVLFFDEINRGSKGFVSADGVIIVGGFFNRCVRYFALLMTTPATFTCPKMSTRAPRHYHIPFLCPKILHPLKSNSHFKTLLYIFSQKMPI